MSLKEKLEAAFMAGFHASGEGFNAEYPFGHLPHDPVAPGEFAEAVGKEKQYCEARDEAVKAILRRRKCAS